MKRITFNLFMGTALVLLVAISACKKEEATLAVLSTTSVSNITANTATSGGNITSDGGSEITARGVCWNTSVNPTISDSKSTDGSGSGQYVSNLTGLSSTETYHVRAYATNAVGTAYGSEVTITTVASIPTVSTTAISAITPSSAVCGGNITFDGGATITERGVCWSTGSNPTIDNNKTIDGAGAGDFSSSIRGLIPGNRYYVRAYATNSSGTSYGMAMSFDAPQITKPTITTTIITNITQNEATSGGVILDDITAMVTNRGVCWSTNQNPTIFNSKTDDGNGTGAFRSSLISLSGNTTYYVRAYATNSLGTVYGNEFIFKTSATVPSVITLSVDEITNISAQSHGVVISDGGAPILVNGFYWSTSPDLQNIVVSCRCLLGSQNIDCIPSNLRSSTTYYVKSYAVNSVGEAYGNEVSFTTAPPELPIITTYSIVEITTNSAVSHGEVYFDGGSDILSQGICWSTHENPDITDSHTANCSHFGNLTCLLSGLLPNVVYYARCYATNLAGTGYGKQIRFQTTSLIP